MSGIRLVPGLGLDLSLRQTQKLIMTPELRLALQILQLSTIDLAERIEEELLANPVLETGEEGSTAVGDTPEKETAESDAPETGPDLALMVEYFLEGRDLGLSPQPRRDPSEIERPFEPVVPQQPTLQEHLFQQARLATSDETALRVVQHLIGCLDDNGYLGCDVDEAASLLGVKRRQAENGIRLLQSFDPPGVGARDLRECLSLQLRSSPEGSPVVAAVPPETVSLAKAIIARHLPDLADGHLAKIAAAQKAELKQVQDAADLIRTLEPKPARGYAAADANRYIVPDASIEKTTGQAEEEFIVVMNDSALPRLGVSPFYRDVLAKSAAAGADPEAARYLRERLASALWFLRSIEQRRLTLYRVIEAMAVLQHDFLEKGVRHLRPMTLKDVADAIGVHESTVSRAVANKYVQTPQGVFELKFFFSSGVDRLGGQGIASESVKKLIGDLVAKEDPADPLSDQRLTELLAQSGVVISRRTVAKYREEAGIPASGRRKRYD